MVADFEELLEHAEAVAGDRGDGVRHESKPRPTQTTMHFDWLAPTPASWMRQVKLTATGGPLTLAAATDFAWLDQPKAIPEI